LFVINSTRSLWLIYLEIIHYTNLDRPVKLFTSLYDVFILETPSTLG